MRRNYEPDVSQILALYQQLEDDILASMTKRMLKMGYVSESTKYQAEILQSAGLLREDVAEMIAQRTDASVQQVKALFEDAGVETVRIDNEIYREAGVLPIDIRQDEGMRNLLEEGYRRTLGTMQNLVGTTAAQTEQQFISACDRAYMQVSSGAFSYQEAIMTAVKSFADIGAEVVYPSGHRDKLDVAVRRAVLTGVGQATATVSLKHADEAGCDLMELSAHSGARPDHAEWQGQLVSRTGKNAGRTIDGLHVYSLDQIGYGTGRGFKGWNCRHNWYPYYEGFSKPNYTKQQIAALNAKHIPYNGQMYSEYEISQMQRAAERKIRKLKRRLITAQESVKTAPDNATRAAAQNYYNRNAVKLKDAEKQLRDFCNQTGQWNDKFRTQVSGFNHSQAQKAVWANRKAQQGKNPPPASPAAPSVPKSPKPKNPSGSAANSLTSSNRSGIINSAGKNFGQKRNQLPVPYQGLIQEKDLSSFNQKALQSIIAETGYSQQKAQEFQDALHEWLGGDYESFTAGQQKDKEAIINEGLSRMGAYDGEIHRGLSFRNAEDFRQFSELEAGQKIPQKSVSSWSDKPDIAENYAAVTYWNRDSVILICENNKSAVGVRHISKYGTDESEVLAPSTTSWKVVRKEIVNKYDYISESIKQSKDAVAKEHNTKIFLNHSEELKKYSVVILWVEEE